MKHISKYFTGVKANDDINIELRQGEVLALLGENGAGKTTLMNILFGIYKADSGEILINGEKAHISSPHDALKYGVGMVQQHFTLVPSFTTAENIVLGLKELGFIPKTKNVESRIEELGKRYGLPVNPRAKVWTLSVGEKQRIEILKLLYTGAKILILDEPTAVLTPQEAEALFEAVRKMVADGASVIFISHKLDEVMEVSDRVTVLRSGKVVGTANTAEITKNDLARMMVGREVILDIEKPEVEIGKKVLEINNLKVKNDKGLIAVNGISLEIRAGEVLGIAGVAGNGQRELAEAVYGLRRAESGKVLLNGKDITNLSVSRRIREGIAYIPEDRKETATCPDLSVANNLFLKNTITRLVNSTHYFVDRKKIMEKASELIESYSIMTPSPKMPVKLLSGGNIQKVVLARELSTSPSLIIASHPTRGLDIGAMEFVYRTLLEQKKRGAAILLLAGELYEIFRLSDRVAVIYEGEIAGYAPPDPAYIEEIGLMMGGSKKAGEAR
ncbi:ABC transporter ATP-binding protein [Kosmotoga pacifica]|uniref:Heme ABC transporter ATP-binding protein n=1 Tax=Kosmotoga pacifica TaxID=1330330 RepID=A0A0G2ZFF7_9BACT|nr:ABC transporter ATP-binding protein [Kosmotoga pacifica]AKI98284.1 heme ABC transporter ATP-binding protein [Kosmotoga pacifica]